MVILNVYYSQHGCVFHQLSGKYIVNNVIITTIYILWFFNIVKLACIYRYCNPLVAFSGVSGESIVEKGEIVNMATIGIADMCEDSTSDGAPTINIINEEERELLDEEERELLDEDDDEEQDEIDDRETPTHENRRVFERNDSGTSFSSLISQTSTNTKPCIQGPRYKLINDGDIPICRLNHTRTIVSKIMNSRYLRRWELHKIYLDKTEICSATVSWFVYKEVNRP